MVSAWDTKGPKDAGEGLRCCTLFFPFHIWGRRTPWRATMLRGMPRYFFDVSLENGPWSEDDGGTDLPDDEAARVAALDLALTVAKEPPVVVGALAVRVRNHEPYSLATVRLLVETENR